MKKKKHLVDAYTIFEILIAVAMMGMLLMLALPNQASNIAKVKAIEAKNMLNHVYSLEKNHFYVYSKYSSDLEEIGFDQELLAPDGGMANYRITIESASATGYTVKAESVVDFDADGILNVWQIDQDKILKELVKD